MFKINLCQIENCNTQKSPDPNDVSLDPYDDEKIISLFQSWATAVTVNKDPELVTSKFTKDGELYATDSSFFRKGYFEIKEYFEYFTSIPGLRVEDYIVKSISKLNENIYALNVSVKLSSLNENNQRENRYARQTFIFKNNLISLLHSSTTPTEFISSFITGLIT